MNDTNIFTLEGNLTENVTVRELDDGQVVVNGQLANNRYVKDDGSEKGWRQYSHYFPLVFWNGIARKAEKLTLGSRVLVSGHQRQERWITESGEKRSCVRFYVESLSVMKLKKRK